MHCLRNGSKKQIIYLHGVFTNFLTLRGGSIMRWYWWLAPSWWRLELKKDESKRMDIDDFLETVRRYTDATTITKRMVAELIDHIEVYHAEKQDGITNQRVVIHYNCIGAFDVPDRRKIPEADIIMETRKGVALSYAPEQVAV